MIVYYAYWNEYFGFRFSFPPEAADVPQWPQSEPFPPLSPRVAIERSRAVVQQLLQEVHPFDPEFRACSLCNRSEQHEGYWYYIVSWSVPDLEDVRADWSEFAVPVLFDGSTPQPLKFRYEDRFDVYRTPAA